VHLAPRISDPDDAAENDEEKGRAL